MRIPASAMPVIRLVTVLVFVGVCALIFGYLWLGAGGRIPAISEKGYRVSADIPSVDNLVVGSDVTTAGVDVGKVVDIKLRDNQPRVTMQFEDDRAPLHEGAVVKVRYKTLLQESFLEVVDGKGGDIADGTNLPAGSSRESVDLDDVLSSIDEPTRKSLATVVRSLGKGTKDTHTDISSTLDGLGHLGREGKTALDALADQSAALKRLTGNSATMLAALDNQQGQIERLVSDANKITKVTADDKPQLEAVMRRLPGVIDNARTAGKSLPKLSRDLSPIAKNLDKASPDLTAALHELPATAKDLRGLLPSLDGVLDKAPSTLDKVPPVSTDLRRTIPNARVVLGDVNPMLAYLQPYGKDAAAWFANTADAGEGSVDGKHHAKFTIITNDQSVRGIPGGTNDLIPRRNPYPGPGAAVSPAPFGGEYPRVTEGG